MTPIIVTPVMITRLKRELDIPSTTPEARTVMTYSTIRERILVRPADKPKMLFGAHRPSIITTPMARIGSTYPRIPTSPAVLRGLLTMSRRPHIRMPSVKPTANPSAANAATELLAAAERGDSSELEDPERA
jgi:hypothetical protein